MQFFPTCLIFRFVSAALKQPGITPKSGSQRGFHEGLTRKMEHCPKMVKFTWSTCKKHDFPWGHVMISHWILWSIYIYKGFSQKWVFSTLLVFSVLGWHRICFLLKTNIEVVPPWMCWIYDSDRWQEVLRGTHVQSFCVLNFGRELQQQYGIFCQENARLLVVREYSQFLKNKLSIVSVHSCEIANCIRGTWLPSVSFSHTRGH